MNLLAIDTSTHIASVALSYDGKIYTFCQDGIKQHAMILLPAIRDLLDKAGISMTNLDGIAFGRGPGSFTGLRIACSVAQGLALARDLPVYPVSTLATIAYAAREQNPLSIDPVLAVIDARMNQLYWACFDKNGHSTEEFVNDAADIIPADYPEVILAGTGFETYLNDLPRSLNITKKLKIYPEASVMVRQVCQGSILAVSAEDALPVYIRNQVVS